jgi:hypothetical protein
MRRKRRAAAGAQADESDEKRTFSPLLVLTIVLVPGAVGLVLLILLGATGTTPTEQVASDQTVVVTSSTTTTAVEETTTTTTIPLVFPDGSAVPERIVEVQREPGQSTYLYAVAPELTGSDSATAIPPTGVEVVNEGTALSINMLCTISQGSAPSRIIVVEDPLEVRVTAIAAAKRLGQPCEPLQLIESITIPLDAPIGGRRLVISNAGSTVEE